MNANDWLAIGGYILWIATITVGAYLGNGLLKDKKLDSKTKILTMLVKNAVNFYETTELSDDVKKNKIISDVANSLQSKGFNVSEQTIKDITHAVETAFKNIEKTSDKSKPVEIDGFKPKGDDKSGK